MSNWRSWLFCALLTPTFLGCQSIYPPAGLPRDPLFLSKTPVAAKARFAPPVVLAYREPTAPQGFMFANVPDNAPPTVPATLTNRPAKQD
jgi:hypothetical protein